MRVTKHANKRMQQRALPELWIQLLHRFGDVKEQKGGAQEIYLSSRARKQLRRELKKVTRQFDHLQHAYLIEQGNAVITAGHKYRD